MFFLDRFSFKKWFLSEAINTPLLAGQYRKVYPQATDQEITDKINLAAAADPTPNKKYINWVFRELIKSRIRLPEDAPVVQQQLGTFEKSKPVLKRLGKELNIDKYDKNQLWQTLGELGGATSVRQEKQAIKQEGAKEIYDDGEWLVMQMTKGEACSFYARGTKWCTSDPKTANAYLAEGPIYIIYHNKQIYAQFHIESEQFMDPQDVAIHPDKVPEKLKEIIRDYVLDTDKVKRNKMFGIKEKVLTFPDGYYWGTADYQHIYLMDPANTPQVQLVIREGTAFLGRPQDKNAHALFNQGSMTAVKNYISPTHWNKYILQLLIKNKDVKRIGIHNDQWSLGDLSKQELSELEKARPDLFPKVHLETTDGYLWTEGEGVDRQGLPEELVLMDNWRPILLFSMSPGHAYLSYGKWLVENLYQTFLKNTEIDRHKYSLATTELILNDKISHVDNRRNLHGNWSLNDLLPQHQKIVLQAFPGFDEPLSLISKINLNDKKSIVKEISRLSNLSHLVPFNDDYVIVDDYDVISPHSIIDKHSNRKIFYGSDIGPEILRALKNKISGEFGVNDDWKLQELLKANDIDSIRKIYPFIDEETLALMREKDRWEVGAAFKAAIGSAIMPKIIKLIYEKLSRYSNDKFKVILSNNKIYFVMTYNDLIKDFQADKELKELYEEYKNWKKSIEADWSDLIKAVEEMPRAIDKDKFKEVLEQGYGHPDYRRYDIDTF